MTALKSAYQKLDRAEHNIREYSTVLAKECPFLYILETNTETNQRCLYAKKNDVVVDRLAQIAGDAIGNLREALDHAYWEIVSPLAKGNPDREREIQFPFCETLAKLKNNRKYKFAEEFGNTKLSGDKSLAEVILALKPYDEAGGDKTLYLIHRMNNIDKHRLSTPLADYKSVTINQLIAIAEIYIPWNGDGTLILGGNKRDMVWSSKAPYGRRIGKRAPEAPHTFEKILDVPMTVYFCGTQTASSDETLILMRDKIRNALIQLSPFAAL